MQKTYFRAVFGGITTMAIVAFLLWEGLKAENFGSNLALNLLTEILGAVLVAYYLKSNIDQGLVNLKDNIVLSIQKNQVVPNKINNAFSLEDPNAWTLLLELKKKELEVKINTLNLIDSENIEAREKLTSEIGLLRAYIKASEAITAI